MLALDILLTAALSLPLTLNNVFHINRDFHALACLNCSTFSSLRLLPPHTHRHALLLPTHPIGFVRPLITRPYFSDTCLRNLSSSSFSPPYSSHMIGTLFHLFSSLFFSLANTCCSLPSSLNFMSLADIYLHSLPHASSHLISYSIHFFLFPKLQLPLP